MSARRARSTDPATPALPPEDWPDACAERRERHRAARERARAQRRVLLLTALAAAALVAGWRTLATGSSAASGEIAPARGGAPVSRVRELDAAEKQAPATPLFATHDGLRLHLPVPEADLTELAFHQACYDTALPMQSLLPDADPATANQKRGTGRTYIERDPQDTGEAILGGTVIRMWRSNRYGQPDTAADVGALPGTPVIAPVNGTVIDVKHYELYGKYEDIEIHIQPAGRPEIDLVMIHVTDPTIRVGESVVGGVTRIASVRRLSDRIDHQIAEYTPDAGDHTHMQINRVEQPGTTEPAGES